MATDPQILRHRQWLGYVRPHGLVVAPLALVEAQAYLADNVIEAQRRLAELLVEVPLDEDTKAQVIPSFPRFAESFLGWRGSDLVPGEEAGLEAHLPEYHETLQPTWAVRAPEPVEAASPWLLVVQALPHGTPLDEPARFDDDRRWQATWQVRFERLLRETHVPIGLLCNGTALRLVYAPSGESSGHLTFDVKAMTEVAGRPILAGLCLLLDEHRLFTEGRQRRLPALLERSRKYQNDVSTRLADQVLEALHELLRGFQRADADAQGALLRDVLRDAPDEIYGGLLTVVLRLIFLLYAEDRGLLGGDAIYASGYSVQGLFDRLRSDADRFPDTMDQRPGAWPQLLALFRLVFDGASHGKLKLPPRHGSLFWPDRFPFLEGRPRGSARQALATLALPRIADGVVWRVLQRLMLLEGERLSYRALDVEHIGSVYETMMGFRLEVTRGPSLAIKAGKPRGAPSVIDLDELLAVAGAKRNASLKQHTDQKLSGDAATQLAAARTPEELHAALGRKVASITPQILPAGTMVLQPSDARRKSGSHYTPRRLTEPIVKTALRPILAQLGESPEPEQLLSLKVCDPAMGSGAFLVEACRQLGKALVRSWHAHGSLPSIPPDEDEEIHACRLIAQRCLYGVDRNPFAVDLAKLSLWLATFARDHAFTFLDHALRCGDSLVGLSQAQIAGFNWEPSRTGELFGAAIQPRLKEALALRARIGKAGDTASDDELRRLLREADEALADVRLIGDLAIAAFFAGGSAKEREQRRRDHAGLVAEWQAAKRDRDELRALVDELRDGPKGVVPFHWQVEFPEVFERGGFDAFIGNPPFAGKNSILDSNADGYIDWLKTVHEESHGNSDLVAHFFRRAFTLLRDGGTFGLIATKTIRQGDTRSTGLRWICTHGGEIYEAKRRHKWIGEAAVVVSVVHAYKGAYTGERRLDGEVVPRISAFLFHDGGHDDPAVLRANAGKSFQGSIVLGMGFTFDDTNDEATPVAEMERLIAKDPRNCEVIFPYIGGEEINDSPTQAHRRWVIHLGERSEEEARRGWPELMRIVEEKVRPQRQAQRDAGAKEKWWQFIRPRPELHAAIRDLDRVLVVARNGDHCALTFLPARIVHSDQLVVFAISSCGAFATLQSRVHEGWARFLASTMKDDLRYTPSDCFETFPLPTAFDTSAALEEAGRAYYADRAQLMVDNDEGLTATYNRFHDPDERSAGIARLRELHAAMDRAVLDAYGWTDLRPTHEFLLDYEEDEDGETDGAPRRRSKPWRYRWPDDFHDEVLMRLLRLNQERAAEEALRAVVVSERKPTRKRGSKARAGLPGLFDRDEHK